VAEADSLVPLVDFVAAIRGELQEAQKTTDPSLPLEVGPITVELTLLTRREGEGRAGVKFWVVEAGFTAKLGSESTQRVTIELNPIDPASGRRARVRDIEPRR
jgi:hypothetical protein